MIYEIKDTNKISPLFGHWEETLIWSCLQGIMGKIYANDLTAPTAAMAVIGDFTFFAGEPCPELIAYRPPHCTQNFMIAVPQNKLWENMLTQFYGKKAKIISRYATKKEPPIFNKHHLEKIVASLPKQYTLSMIDSHFYKLCKSEAWSKRSRITIFNLRKIPPSRNRRCNIQRRADHIRCFILLQISKRHRNRN